MNKSLVFLASLVLAAVPASVAPVDALGKSLPTPMVTDLAQTKAKSLDDYAGRTILVEFFAYW